MMAEAEQDARRTLLRKRLSATLRALSECCHPPLREATWPSDAQLNGLHFAVMNLAMMERKKPIRPHTFSWVAYKRVDKLYHEVRLIPRMEELVRRADKLLKDMGEPELIRVRRKAAKGVREAQRLADDLEAIQEDAIKASKIEWENYESLLGGGKPVLLACGDSAGSSRLRCYTRALELIVDHLRLWPLRLDALPLLTWITAIGSPYVGILKHNYQADYCANYVATRLTEKAQAHKREQWRKRQKKHRGKKLHAALLAEGISEAEVQEILAANA